ncbi:MAG: carboxypeptidase-like regulatory domain-containing protein, partial [Bacteroidota bacterium]
MKKRYRYLASFLIASALCITAAAQTITILGNVKNSSSKDAVPAVSVTVKGSAAGTFTNEKGDFRLITSQQLPLTLIISSIG